MMVTFVVLLEIIFFIFMCISFFMADENDSIAWGGLGIVLGITLFVFPISIGNLHGYVDYVESNDKDKARITAVTQEQDLFHAYYKVEVEYLTNTPTQSGVVTNYKIEKDVFYCYLTDKDLVNRLKENMYKEVWIISGYKGGYENYKDFGSHLIKDIKLLEEEN